MDEKPNKFASSYPFAKFYGVTKQITKFVQFLKRHVLKVITSCYSNEENMNRACTPKRSTLDLHFKLNPNIEVKSNFNTAKVSEEKTETRNWRFHLTNDHL